MEVSINEWPTQLQSILTQIATAHFVAIDFEISGISLKTNSSSGSQKQTLQQRYEEVKNAAEKYQILQVGLTIVHEDAGRGVYVSRPYNIHMSPLIKEQIAIDRTFAFQSSCTDFLLKHGFQLEKPFTVGIPYLSRQEESDARLKEFLSSSKAIMPNIDIELEEPRYRRTIAYVREKITAWLRAEVRTTSIDIAPEVHPVFPGFTKRERRLIHQLVEQEFKNLTSEAFPDYMRISKRDPMKEKRTSEERATLFEMKLQRQIGLRYLMEALMMGSGSDIIDVTTAMSASVKTQWLSERLKMKNDFAVLSERLRQPTVLVGHNIFVDLVNFYACFIGRLPDTIDEFQREIHQFFPLVFDTKYLATHFNNRVGVRSSLGEVDEDLRYTTRPLVECPNAHGNYDNGLSSSHEAGYDSFVTARVAIKLSTKLEAMGYYQRQQCKEAKSENVSTREEYESSSSASEPVPKRPSKASEELLEAFREPNGTIGMSKEQISTKRFIDRSPSLGNHPNDVHTSTFMPAFASTFWEVYGNRLRINGTREELLVLGS